MDFTITEWHKKIIKVIRMGNNNGKKEVKSNTHFYIDRISLKRTPSAFTINFTDFTFFLGENSQ